MRHRRKTRGVFCWLFIFLHQIAAAQNNLSFAFTSESVVFMGATHECVYEGGACISRLDWKDGAIPAVSFSARAALSGAFLRLNALSALPNVKKLLEQNKMPVTGKASLNFVADIYGTGKIGIDVGTILGFRIGFIGARYNSEPIASFNKEIVKPYTVF